MSVQLIGWALEQRTGSATRKAVLLCLANRANNDTGLCCPSIKTLMAETELGRMTVFRALEALEEAGLIRRVERTRDNGSRTSSEYRFPRVTVVRGEYQSDTGEGVTVIPPEPEVRTRSKTIAAAPQKPNRSHPRWDPVWDALNYVFGVATTVGAKSRRAKVCGALVEADARPDQVIARAAAWPQHFDSATLTDTALEKHWDTLGRKPLRRTR